jgi:hypothetical protein
MKIEGVKLVALAVALLVLITFAFPVGASFDKAMELLSGFLKGKRRPAGRVDREPAQRLVRAFHAPQRRSIGHPPR